MAEKPERLSIKWTTTDEKQFFNVLEYWTERNKSTAYAEKKLTDLVWRKTKFISKNPFASRS